MAQVNNQPGTSSGGMLNLNLFGSSKDECDTAYDSAVKNADDAKNAAIDSATKTKDAAVKTAEETKKTCKANKKPASTSAEPAKSSSWFSNPFGTSAPTTAQGQGQGQGQAAPAPAQTSSWFPKFSGGKKRRGSKKANKKTNKKLRPRNPSPKRSANSLFNIIIKIE